jgi:hypothetical protein
VAFLIVVLVLYFLAVLHNENWAKNPWGAAVIIAVSIGIYQDTS